MHKVFSIPSNHFPRVSTPNFPHDCFLVSRLFSWRYSACATPKPSRIVGQKLLAVCPTWPVNPPVGSAVGEARLCLVWPGPARPAIAGRLSSTWAGVTAPHYMTPLRHYPSTVLPGTALHLHCCGGEMARLAHRTMADGIWQLMYNRNIL